MKKLLFFAMAAMAMIAWSCGDDLHVVDPSKEGYGSIVISSGIKTGTISTRAYDLSNLTMKVTGNGESRAVAVSSAGEARVNDLPAGEYTVEVTSHIDGMPEPAFGAPYYYASKSVTVTAGASTTETIVCKQQNAGVFFAYHESIESKYENLVPTVTQGSKALVYSGADKEATGFFAPETVTVSLKNGENTILIDGQESKELTLAAGKIWRIQLSSGSADGGIDLSITVVEVEDYEDVNWNISDEDSDVNVGGTYFGQKGNVGRFVISMTKGASEEIVLEAYSDMYAKKADFRPASGAYTVSAEPRTFGFVAGSYEAGTPAGSYHKKVKDGITTVTPITGGQFSISRAEDGKYTVNGTLTGTPVTRAGDVEINIAFSGEIPFADESPEIVFKSCSTPAVQTGYMGPYDDKDYAMLEIDLLVDATGGYDAAFITLIVPKPEGDPVRAVYEGVYRFSPTPEMGAALNGYMAGDNNPRGTCTYMVKRSPSGTSFTDIVFIDGGTVVLELAQPYNPEWRNQKYNIWFHGTGISKDTGERRTVAYNSLGPNMSIIDITPGPDQFFNVAFDSVKSDFYGDYPTYGFSNATIGMAAYVNKMKYSLQFDVYMETTDGEVKIVPGTYVASSERQAGVFHKGFRDQGGLVLSSASMMNENTWTLDLVGPITGGSINITNSGDTYTINGQVTGTNEENKHGRFTFDLSYEGPIEFNDKRTSFASYNAPKMAEYPAMK